MKIIDGDKLLKEIKEMDLEYMQQADVIDCLEDLINKQPVISKEININKEIKHEKICRYSNSSKASCYKI